ncbi:hypothetical protein AVBRAN12640_06425 [Campylobacter sp. RM12640]|uniref:aromatic amino acid transport family protein n=1 Tax=unclassified Campylobacter TaxID=2593542 RepID=UPI003014FEB3|nr:hypothetical protein [Campylobacter sp. RM12640]MBZ7989379.1 hypothetical protein [Campylobacter sp. RM12635]
MSKQQKDYFYDLTWIFMVLGSAIGAGVLFLPIKLGENGIISVFIVWIIMVFVNTRTHFLLSLLCIDEKAQINDKSWFLRLFKNPISYVLMCIYVLPIFFTMIFLSLSLINAIEFLLHNRFNMLLDRNIIVVFTVLILVFLSILKLSFIKSINNILVIILCSSLVLFSLYLFVYVLYDWNTNEMLATTNINDTSKTILESLPIAIHSFSYLPLVFIFVKDLKNRYMDYEIIKIKIKKITLISNLILISIIMFFALVCILAVDYNDLNEIKKANISIVSYLAEKHNNFLISWIVPIVTSIAIVTSFFSYYIGSVLGVFELLKLNEESKNAKIIVNVIFIISLICFAIYNPSILAFIGKISGPLIAFVSIILPLYVIYKKQEFFKYRFLIFDLLLLVSFLLIIYTY